MYQGLVPLQNAILSGKTSCLSLVNYYLDKIASQGHLNVFLEVYAEDALQRAEEVDTKIKNGTAGKLAGIVVGLKDVLSYQGHGLQASSKILDGFTAQFSGTAVQRLLDEDAIIIGRQNCDEFAMGSSNENSAFGATRNSVAEDRVPGGSSGASAVAVAADMCFASLGSDTGGSVRQPAAFCGVYGLKPTYSRVSRYGLIAYASSFDVIGLLTKDIASAALILEVISGADGLDSTASQEPVPTFLDFIGKDSSPKKLGYIRETVEHKGIDGEISSKVLKSLDILKTAGHTVEPIDFPLLDYVLPTYYILTAAEASTNLSRFDGVRYGHRSTDVGSLEEMYKKSRSEGFGDEVKRRIMLGTFVLSASYHDAYFTKAQKVRRLIRESTVNLLEEYDFILMPTTPTTAFPIGKFDEDSIGMYLADLFTVQASVAGVPAISIPVGKDSSGLPIGLQVMANSFKEGELLAFSEMIAQTLKTDQPF